MNFLQICLLALVVVGPKPIVAMHVQSKQAGQLVQAKYMFAKEMAQYIRQNNVRQYKFTPGFSLSEEIAEKSRTVLVGIVVGGLILGLTGAILKQIEDYKAGNHVRKVEKMNITFADVAGAAAAKEELGIVIDFLKNSEKYLALGARAPRGVLLYGPPGNGKTLLAKAVAGETGAAFFEAKATDFIDQYVGVGTVRVREFFKRVRQQTPAIVFIDEIDSIGSKRGTAEYSKNSNDTLNQFLTELDGFSSENSTVVIIGATNRKDILDEALIRPGRFDAAIEVPLPTERERLDVLIIHAQKKKLSDDVSLEGIAHSTINFSGADLEALLNRAALLAVRRNKAEIGNSECTEILEEILKSKAIPQTFTLPGVFRSPYQGSRG